MAVALSQGVEKAVTLATTVTRLTRTAFDLKWRQLCILRKNSGSVATVYVVTGNVDDGAALPSEGRQPFLLSQCPLSLDIEQYGYIGLAGDAAGEIEVVIR